MSTKVKEFRSVKDYESWLGEMGDRIRVINLSTSRKKWSPWTGMMNLENAQTYTVTYEELPPPQAFAPQNIGKRCANCGVTNPADTKFCGNCGNSLDAPNMQNIENLCTNCGAINPPKCKFCQSCGTPLFKPPSNPKRVDKNPA
jgi:hypothetical protein